MVGRRGSSFGLQMFSVAIVLIMFVYGFYLYRTVSSQLENVEKENSELILEKEELSRDIQVLRESKSKLEQMLKEKESQCAGNEDRLGSEIKKIREEISKEKMSCDDRVSAWNTERDRLKLQIEELESDKSESMTKIDEMKTISDSLNDQNLELKKTKQENMNEIAKLNDEVANLARHVKELTKYKELYELQRSNSTDTKPKEKLPKKDVDDQEMQIIQPGSQKGYHEIKSLKPRVTHQGEPPKDVDFNAHASQDVDKQVVPPVIEKPNKHDERMDKLDNLHHRDHLQPLLPNEDAKQVKEPKIAENQPKMVVNEPHIPDMKIMAGERVQDDKLDIKPEGKVQAPNLHGEGDDEDLEGERAPNGDREAPQGERNPPEGVDDNDAELEHHQQRMDKEP